mgnify:CR=1 FL=1
MKKNSTILIVLVALPIALAYIYKFNFEYSGGWLEKYQDHFILGFLLIALIGSAWLCRISSNEKNKIWLSVSIVLSLWVAFSLYAGLVVANLSFP